MLLTVISRLKGCLTKKGNFGYQPKRGEGVWQNPKFLFHINFMMKNFFGNIINKIINITDDMAIYLLTENLKRQLFIISTRICDVVLLLSLYANVPALTMQTI